MNRPERPLAATQDREWRMQDNGKRHFRVGGRYRDVCLRCACFFRKELKSPKRRSERQ